MKLFEVIRTFYVMAEDGKEAESYQPKDPLACTNEVYEAKAISADWEDAIPFGEQKDDKTCGQIITDSQIGGHQCLNQIKQEKSR